MLEDAQQCQTDLNTNSYANRILVFFREHKPSTWKLHFRNILKLDKSFKTGYLDVSETHRFSRLDNAHLLE